MELKLEEWDIILSKEWVQKILPKTQYLYLDGLENFKKHTLELCTKGFRELKCLDIDNSPSIECIANSSNGEEVLADDTGEEEALDIDNIPSIESIANSSNGEEEVLADDTVELPKGAPIQGYWRRVRPRQHDTADCSVLLDFESMKELQVLYVRFIHIAILPSSIGILRNLHSLYLDYCNVEDAAILGKLKALQILSLAGSALSRLPIEIGALTNLRSLNLSDCDRLTIEPGVLKYLINLEELYLRRSFDQWRGKDGILSKSCNASLVELKGLTKIASLEISIPDPSVLLEDDFPFGNLIKFWINIGNPKGWTTGVLRTMELKLEEWDIILSKEWVQKLLQKTQYLYLDGLENFKKHTLELCTEGFRELKCLDINNSPSIECIANSSNGEEVLADDTGEEEALDIDNIPSIESIANSSNGEVEVLADDTVELPKGAPIQVSLPHLESLTMVRLLGPEEILCSEHSLKYTNLRELTIEKSESTSKSILKLDWILKLPNLESMTIENSPSAKVVFDLEEIEVIEDVEILSRLTDLTLKWLPNLHCVCKQDVRLQGISIFRNLRDLHIYKTDLSFLFSVSVAKCFREIRTIKVLDCPKMKAVIVDEGRNEGTNDIIEFPLLKYLSIKLCRVEKFFSYPCGKKEPITTNSDSQDVNSDSFFDQKVTFPNITTLDIDGLQCKELWNNHIPTDSFLKLEYLGLENCDNLQRIATSYMWKKLQCCLKELEVISCPSIEIIYEGDGTDTESGKLRRLNLGALKNLRCIWQSNSLPNIPFPNLRDIQVMDCPRLEMLFPTFTAKFLEQIERLVLLSCEDMELIVGREKWEEATGTTITFSKLIVLRLSKLPKFRRFFLPEKYSMKFPCSEDFPSLRDLRVESCGIEPNQLRGRNSPYILKRREPPPPRVHRRLPHGLAH